MAHIKSTHQGEILTQVSFNSKQRVYFQNYERAPQYGVFVKLADHDELLTKGYIRFVSDSKSEDFERNRYAGFTRMFRIDEIKYLKTT